MKNQLLKHDRIAKITLLFLFFGSIGMMNGYAQSIKVDNLRYSINKDGTSVTFDGYAYSLPNPSSLTIPASIIYNELSYTVTGIANNVFWGVSELTSLTLPASLTTIGEYAFWNCCGLTSITIPSSVISIGKQAFTSENSRLEEIIVASGNQVYDSRNNCNAIIETNTNKLVLGCKNTIIPNSVISIGENAFYGCEGLVSITIPNSVSNIGNSAFFGCTNLSSIFIPQSITSIGTRGLSNCSKLEQIVVAPNNTIYDSRDNCNAIINSTTNELIAGCMNTIIPSSVTSIGENAFFRCSGLTSVDIPNSVTNIGHHAFTSCGLTSVSIPNSVTSLNDGVFSMCSNLSYVIIPNSVSSIGYQAFYYCNSLTSIAIPHTVNSIGGYAFFNCSNLSSVFILNETPPSFGTDWFEYWNRKIYVPYESLDLYKAKEIYSDLWKDAITPMAYTVASGYGTSNGSWTFIASPLVETTDPTTVDNMITETKYDLYRFDQSEELEWQNYEERSFNLVNGQGYLYANAEDANIIFKGTFNEDETKDVDLIYDANSDFAGLSLVGNPFPVDAYINRSYYVMNEFGTEIKPVAVSTAAAIPPCTGVMVRAESTETNPKVTFSKTAPQNATNNGNLQIAVTQNSIRGNAMIDQAIVSFNEGDKLGKYLLNEGNARLYIQQGDKEYAIVCAEKLGETPLNFKVKENGTYALSINPENVEMEYLHLIDNLTGNDIDLLQTPSYTFNAKKSDYASRFRLVFVANGAFEGSDSGSEAFAYFNNGKFIVNNEGEATLQVIDITGHVLSSEQISGSCHKAMETTSGVYMLRLINGDKVRTQKVIVK